MITTQIYYWHDGVLEITDSLNHEGCSHLIVILVDGIPKESFIWLG